MGSNLQMTHTPSPPPPPLVRKCRTESKTSNKPQASCPLVCTHTWSSEAPWREVARGEVLLTGFVFPALFCGVGSVVGGVCCLDAGVIFRVWGRAPLVTVRFIGQSPMQLAAPHLAPLHHAPPPLRVPSQWPSKNSFFSVSWTLNAGAVVPDQRCGISCNSSRRHSYAEQVGCRL